MIKFRSERLVFVLGFWCLEGWRCQLSHRTDVRNADADGEIWRRMRVRDDMPTGMTEEKKEANRTQTLLLTKSRWPMTWCTMTWCTMTWCPMTDEKCCREDFHVLPRGFKEGAFHFACHGGGNRWAVHPDGFLAGGLLQEEWKRWNADDIFVFFLTNKHCKKRCLLHIMKSLLAKTGGGENKYLFVFSKEIWKCKKCVNLSGRKIYCFPCGCWNFVSGKNPK